MSRPVQTSTGNNHNRKCSNEYFPLVDDRFAYRFALSFDQIDFQSGTSIDKFESTNSKFAQRIRRNSSCKIEKIRWIDVNVEYFSSERRNFLLERRDEKWQQRFGTSVLFSHNSRSHSKRFDKFRKVIWETRLSTHQRIQQGKKQLFVAKGGPFTSS